MKKLIKKLKDQDKVIEIRFQPESRKYYIGKINEIAENYFSLMNDRHSNTEIFIPFSLDFTVKVFGEYNDKKDRTEEWNNPN